MRVTYPNHFYFSLAKYPGLGERFRQKCYRKNKNFVDVVAELMEKWVNEPEVQKPYIDMFQAERNQAQTCRTRTLKTKQTGKENTG